MIFIKRFIFFILQFFVKKKITKVNQNGIEFKVETHDKLGEEWNLINDYELSEFQTFTKVNKNNINKVFFFGAHQCMIPIKIHKIFLPKSDFYCFEVLKKNYLIGINNIKHNNCQNHIQLINEAISVTNGFDYFDPISLNSFKVKNRIFSKKIKSSDLETIINKYGKAELFFFDIEGFEGQVIEKSINFLRSWKNYLFIECHGDEIMKKYNYSNSKLYKILKHNNYQTFKLIKDNESKAEKFIQVSSEKDVPTVRFYMLAMN